LEERQQRAAARAMRYHLVLLAFTLLALLTLLAIAYVIQAA
jgi:hypothetical protein